MTPENLCWLIGSIGVLFLISISTWLETEVKKIDQKWEFQRHNGYATLLIWGKILELRKETKFWIKIWMIEYDYYNNLNIPEKRIYRDKLLSFGKTLRIMFYSIPHRSFKKEVIA